MVTSVLAGETGSRGSLLPRLQERLFGAQDSVCLARARLVTEAWHRWADEPAPVRRALALRHVLRNLPLDMHGNPVFAGNTSIAPRAWCVMPEFGFEMDAQACVEHDWIHPDWLRERVPTQMLDWWKDRHLGGGAGTGHLAIDSAAVVQRGLDAILHDLEQEAGRGSEAQQVYRRAMAIAVAAVIEWAQRYAEAAEAEALRCPEPQIAALHRRVASACRHVPRRPARNLFEGLQAMVLTHLALVLEGQGTSISIGLPDRALAPLADEAAADPDAAAELCGAFLLKIASNSYLGRVSKTQAVTLGGADHAGTDRCNAVTLAFLGGFERVAVADPHCFLRWHRDIDPIVWEKALHLLSNGRSMPLLVNDHAAAAGLIAAGIRPEDAWDYCIIGCNEIGVPGRACQTACCKGMYFNDLALLDSTLRQSGDLDNAEATLAAYRKTVLEAVREGIATRREWIHQTADRKPFPLTSALMAGCIDAGDDYQRAMPYPDIYCAYTRGTSNAINALAALEQLVWTGRMSLRELLSAVDAGDEAVGQRLRSCPRWGNDDDRADRWAAVLDEARTAALRQAAAEAGLPPILCCHVVRSLHHVDGRGIGPTLDGRRSAEAVADSIGAVCGEAAAGPTAMLNSVLKLNAVAAYAGIYNLNLTLAGGAQSSPPVLRALCEAFFHDGGQELQINVLDARKLQAAMERPADFQDLVVRIAGLNARFVELSALEQQEIIRRAEYAAGS